MTDTERIDFLQYLTTYKKYTGKVILRNSESNRGWRLHESSNPEAVEDVRQAIDDFAKKIFYKI
jgi:hypothetical protein